MEGRDEKESISQSESSQHSRKKEVNFTQAGNVSFAGANLLIIENRR